MNFFDRILGVFLRPQAAFQALAEKPVWLDAFIVLLILAVLFSNLVSPFARNDRIQLLKDNLKLKERMGEERFNQLIDRTEHPSQTGAIIQNFLVLPLFSVVGYLFSSLIILVIGRLFSSQGNYVHVFSALLHANFVDKLLGNAVRLFLAFSRKSVMQTSTGIALFFPRMESTSTAYIFLSQVDFFQIWLFGILAYGLSFILKIELKKALFISYLFWLLKSLFYIGLGILGMSYMR